MTIGGLGYQVSDLGSRLLRLEFGFSTSDLWLRIWGLGFGVYGL